MTMASKSLWMFPDLPELFIYLHFCKEERVCSGIRAQWPNIDRFFPKRQITMILQNQLIYLIFQQVLWAWSQHWICVTTRLWAGAWLFLVGLKDRKKKKPVTEEQSRARTQYNIFSINFPWNKMRGGAEPSGRRQFGRVSCTMYLFHPLICRNNLGSNLKQLRLYERF